MDDINFYVENNLLRNHRWKGPLHSQLPDIVDLTGTSSEEDDHVQSSVKRKRCDVTKACPNCFIDVAIGAGISSSCAKVSCPACGALFCGLCAKKASRTRCDCQKKVSVAIERTAASMRADEEGDEVGD